MRKIMLLAAMLAMLLVMAAPAPADTVATGGLIAGTADNGLVVAGNPNLLDDPAADVNLAPGADIAAAGDLVPPGVFATGVNIPFTVDFGVAGVAAEDDDVVIQSNFLGTDSIHRPDSGISRPTQRTGSRTETRSGVRTIAGRPGDLPAIVSTRPPGGGRLRVSSV